MITKIDYRDKQIELNKKKKTNHDGLHIKKQTHTNIVKRFI